MGSDWICGEHGRWHENRRGNSGIPLHSDPLFSASKPGSQCSAKPPCHQPVPGWQTKLQTTPLPPLLTLCESISIRQPATMLSMCRHSRCARNPGSKGKLCAVLKGYHSAQCGLETPVKQVDSSDLGSSRAACPGSLQAFMTHNGQSAQDRSQAGPRTIMQRNVELQHGEYLRIRCHAVWYKARIQGRDNLQERVVLCRWVCCDGMHLEGWAYCGADQSARLAQLASTG